MSLGLSPANDVEARVRGDYLQSAGKKRGYLGDSKTRGDGTGSQWERVKAKASKMQPVVCRDTSCNTPPSCDGPVCWKEGAGAAKDFQC